MFYTVICFILSCVSRVIYRVKVSGLENIPQEGAFILCCNHIHSYDPALLAITSTRRLRFMAKKELFRNPIKRFFFTNMGAFPVDRKAASMTSYRKAMNILKEGTGLVIFSQGTKMKTLDINSAKGGVALFAVKAKAPVVPVGISGSYFMFSSLKVRFGQAVTLDDYYGQRLSGDQIDEIMTGIMSRVEMLVD